jgi:hypothetical protein
MYVFIGYQYLLLFRQTFALCNIRTFKCNRSISYLPIVQLIQFPVLSQ